MIGCKWDYTFYGVITPRTLARPKSQCQGYRDFGSYDAVIPEIYALNFCIGLFDDKWVE